MTTRFTLHKTAISGVEVIERLPIQDDRGFFERLFCADELASVIRRPIIQINHSLTRQRGTVRGLHAQHPPHAETKLVSCLRGEMFDVAVDLRTDSPTYLCWHAERLSADNHRALVIPDGCAHGFQALTDNCELLYLNTAAYSPEAEFGLYPGDPRLAIDWPLPLAGLSPRDAAHPLIDTDFQGIAL